MECPGIARSLSPVLDGFRDLTALAAIALVAREQ